MLNPQWYLRIHEHSGGSTGRGVASSSNGKGLLKIPVGGGSKAVGGTGRAEREKASVILSAHGPREVPLNVTGVWSSGERVVECVYVLYVTQPSVMMFTPSNRLAQKEVVISSGAYTYGHARAAANMARKSSFPLCCSI
jgi:calpain-7